MSKQKAPIELAYERYVNAIILLLLVSSFAATAHAEQQILEEVLVTAQKRTESLSEVPLSIQAFTANKIEERGLINITDAIKLIPGAAYSASHAPSATALNLRGIGGDINIDPTIGFYIDDTPFATPSLGFSPPTDLFDLERLEVLRGPQGTLYGLGGLGGTIRLLTANPSHEDGFSGKFRFSASDTKDGESSYGADLALNLPIVDDLVAARLMLGYREEGGYIDATDFPDANGEKDVNDTDVDNIRAKVLITPSEDLSIMLTYWRNRLENGFGNTVTGLNGDALSGTGGEPSIYEVIFDLYSANVSYDFGFATLDNTTSYLEYENVQDIVQNFGAFGVITADARFPSEAWSNELRLTSNSDGPFQWITGFFYRDGELNKTVELFFGIQFPFEETDLSTESMSIFGEASYAFADGLVEVLLGLRYLEDERETAEIIGGTPSPVNTRKFDSVDPRFNISVRPNDDTTFYFNVASTQRSGSVNSNAMVFVGALQDMLTIPKFAEADEVLSYELGSKLTLLEGSLYLETAIYYSEWDNLQMPQFLMSGLGPIVNGGDAELKGVDVSLSWATPIDGLIFGFNGNINESEFVDINPTVAAGGPGFANGLQLPTVPENSYSVSLDYSRPINDGGLELVASGAYSNRGSQCDSSGTAICTDDFRDFSARIGVGTEKWEVTLFGNNLTNSDKSLSVTAASLFGTPRPQEIGVRFTTSF